MLMAWYPQISESRTVTLRYTSYSPCCMYHYHQILGMQQENADFFALPHEGPSSLRHVVCCFVWPRISIVEVLADDRHEHPWFLRRVCRFFWPRISLPPFHEIPAATMEVSVDDGIETTSSGVSSSHVVDSVHPPSPTGWVDIPPPRVHFMCIN